MLQQTFRTHKTTIFLDKKQIIPQLDEKQIIKQLDEKQIILGEN